MGKFNVIQFDSKVLNALKDTPNSGVEAERTKQHLALHPIHLNDFRKSVKDLLNENVARYNRDLDGILLGYENIKLLSTGGFIHTDSCFIHVDIEADFFVFRPKVGEEMNGIVVRKSKDHVGVLVYNTFNVSIPAIDEEEDCWISMDVQVGCEVLFRIVLFTMDSFMPYIRGQLISIIDDKGSAKKRKEKLSTKLVFPDDSEELVITKKSKKEKRKSRENEDSFSENLDVSQITTKKRHKKHKKSIDTLIQDESESLIKEEYDELSNLVSHDIETHLKMKKRKRSFSVSETTHNEHEVESKKQKKKRAISISEAII